eukprot:12911754-Prorocentrum_lima.AAC.1
MSRIPPFRASKYSVMRQFCARKTLGWSMRCRAGKDSALCHPCPGRSRATSAPPGQWPSAREGCGC